MVLFRKATLSIALLVLLAGCSGFKPAKLPTTQGDLAEEEATRPVVVVGAPAKVYLKSGTVVEGDVVQVDSESITIGQAGNYGLKESTFLTSEIEKIEVASSSKASSLAASAVGGVMLVAVSAVVLAFLFLEVGPLD